MNKTLATERPEDIAKGDPPPPGETGHELTGAAATEALERAFPQLTVPEGKISAVIWDMFVRRCTDRDVFVTFRVMGSKYRSIRLRISHEKARELRDKLTDVVE